MTFALDHNERLLVDGVEWQVSRRIADDYQMIHPTTGELLKLTSSDVAERFFSGSLKRVASGAPPTDAGTRAQAAADFTNSSEDAGAAAIRRQAYVDKVITLFGRPPYSDLNLNLAITSLAGTDISGVEPPSTRTLRRWLRKQAPSGFENAAQPSVFLSNANRTQGKQDPAFPNRVETLMLEIIEERLLVQVPETVFGAYGVFKDRIDDENKCTHPTLPLPTYKTFWRRWDAMDRAWRTRRQLGPRAAYREFGPVGEPRQVLWPNQIVEADHNWVACNIVDEDGVALGAGVLTLFLDVYTSMPTGFALSFEPPSYASDMLALRHAVKPKGYLSTSFGGRITADWPCAGVIETLIVDNGADLHSSSLKAACDKLGITVVWAEKASPWQKGHVERCFRTIDETLTLRLPGAKLSGRKLPDDYDPAKAAKVTLAALVELLHMLFADVFPAMPWPYDRTKTRRQAWNEGAAKHPLRLPRSAAEFEILTCARLPTTRQLRRTGIEAFGMYYDSAELFELRAAGAESVHVLYDPTDLSEIFVCSVDKQTEWFKARCKAGKYAKRRTLWQHRRILDHLDPDERRRANEEALLEALSRLRARADEIVGRKRPRRRNVKDHTRHKYHPVSADAYGRPAEQIFADATDEAPGAETTVPEWSVPVEESVALQPPYPTHTPASLIDAGEDDEDDEDDAIAAFASLFTVRKPS